MLPRLHHIGVMADLDDNLCAGGGSAMSTVFEYLERHPWAFIGALAIHTAVLVGLIVLVLR
jgi:hypothetical protein